MLQEIGNKLKRGWYRLNSKAVWPEEVKVGDQLLFDFPGTGPYWTRPVETRIMTWGRTWPQSSKSYLSVWLTFGDSGAMLAEINADSIRVRR